MAQHFKLPDGRNLDYLVSGAQDGFPLVWMHGTPGGYTPDPGLVATCEKQGVRLITFSRPGYGGSTRKHGRRSVDIVTDVQALCGYLGIERCAVGGWSGGGPSTLACAARLPNCVAALCVAGVAPYDAEGLDWLAGQGQDNIEEFDAVRKGEGELQTFCATMRSELLQIDASSLIEAMSTILSDVDKEAISQNADMGDFLVSMFQEGLKNNADGWVDDDLELFQPWGFELSEIKVPVLLYQGSEDRMVPYGHGEWLAKHLPQESVRKYLLQGQGHISIFLGQRNNMIRELLEIAKS